MKPHFENTGLIDPATGERSPMGFELSPPIRQDPYLCPPGCGSWWPMKKAIYEFRLNRQHPLTAVDEHGDRWCPDFHYESDMGSVPRIGQLFIPKDRFLFFYHHDSAYAHGGLWVERFWADPKTRRWEFVKLSRADVDGMLHNFILADPVPGYLVTADVVWTAVRLGGASGWEKGDLRKRLDPHETGSIIRPA